MSSKRNTNMSASKTNEEPPAVTYSPSSAGITTIVIDRAARRNSVNPATAQDLYAAFVRFEDDATQNICVFHGANGTFCAGADLKELATTGWTRKPHFGPVSGRNMGPMGPSRLQIKKPVICAVSGYAVAGGLELSLLGDLRVVEEDTIFGVYCRRFGVPLIDGGTVRLQAIIGLGRAMDMILTGRSVSAQEALSMGLANRVVPKGTAVEEALKLAELMARFPQLCMNKDRESCYFAAYGATSLQHALDFEFDNGKEVIEMESLDGAKRFAGGQGRSDTSPKFGPKELVSSLLSTVENRIVPLTTEGVSTGSKVFGAAILSKTTLAPITIATNNESLSPLLHGEINCIQQYFTIDFPDSKTRPDPRKECIFFATHEPCSLCLSGIAWSGFKEVYYLFTYEDSRDLFSIPHDIDILEQVFRVRAENQDEEELKRRPLYNRDNSFFRARALADVVARIDDAAETRRLGTEIERVKALYTRLGQTYQHSKQRGLETASVWK